MRRWHCSRPPCQADTKDVSKILESPDNTGKGWLRQAVNWAREHHAEGKLFVVAGCHSEHRNKNAGGRWHSQVTAHSFPSLHTPPCTHSEGRTSENNNRTFQLAWSFLWHLSISTLLSDTIVANLPARQVGSVSLFAEGETGHRGRGSYVLCPELQNKDHLPPGSGCNWLCKSRPFLWQEVLCFLCVWREGWEMRVRLLEEREIQHDLSPCRTPRYGISELSFL